MVPAFAEAGLAHCCDIPLLREGEPSALQPRQAQIAITRIAAPNCYFGAPGGRELSPWAISAYVPNFVPSGGLVSFVATNNSASENPHEYSRAPLYANRAKSLILRAASPPKQ